MSHLESTMLDVVSNSSHPEEHDSFVGKGLFELLAIVALPTATMLAGSLTAYFIEPNDKIQAMLSAFAGSLLIGSVAFELGPELMSPAKCGDSDWRFGIIGGFATSYVTILLLDTIGFYLDPEETGGNGKQDGKQGTRGDWADYNEQTPLLNASSSASQPHSASTSHANANVTSLSQSHNSIQGAAAAGVLCANQHSVAIQRRNSDSDLYTAPSATLMGLKQGRRRLSKFHLGKVAELLNNLDQVSEEQPSQAYPIGPVALVAIDGISDGLTLGIAGSLGLTQGIILSASLAVEMMFTGAALSAIMTSKRTSRTSSLVTLSLVPFTMFLGGMLGRLMTLDLSKSGPVYAGMLAFVVGQLFYLATVELIGEGHAVIQASNSPKLSRVFDSLLLLGFVAECLMEAYLKE
eukprot:TRINITY_DN17238_c0_g1_i1.p1 TRINITY_DN17238_c0_g1~~TRINITY_DN17238_c0_g1_i1.p1  ORF type:complete len:407 (+),score=81.12 TRINITY_DN17238_c0_g1_i1:79-1299(+)